MTSFEIFDLALNLGKEADLRTKEQVEKYLLKTKKKYEKLSDSEKLEFDLDKLTNPYPDSCLLYDSQKAIKKIMVGIDISGAELLLAKQMGDIDLVISHHPQGRALADLAAVMPMQAQILANYGLPINIAESVLKLRLQEVSRSTGASNFNRNVDLARVLDLSFMCLHTPADNLAAKFLSEKLKDLKENDSVADLMEKLKEIEEYKIAQKNSAGPVVFAGAMENSLGKVVLTEITGGTSGSKDTYAKMAQYGFGTIVGMHMEEEHRQEAEKNHINVVIAGHMSSDSLGVNLFLDELEKKGLEIMPLGGLTRVKRI